MELLTVNWLGDSGGRKKKRGKKKGDRVRETETATNSAARNQAKSVPSAHVGET